MKSFNIIPKVPQVRLKRNNKAIRGTVCYAAALLGIVALLIGCPDSTGDDNGAGNGDTNGTPIEATEATKVQNAASGATTIDSITLTWDAPTDIDGFLGVSISGESDAGSLGDAVELDDSATEYQVTNLEAATEYTFTIATRYTDSRKNNGTIVIVTTLSEPTPATLVQNATSAATTDTITLNWALPTDTNGYLGITITGTDTSGTLLDPVELDDDVTEYQFTALASGITYTFTIATRYTDSGKNNSTIVPAMTALATEVQAVVLDATETTSDSATITWTNPVDAVGYTRVSVTISVDPPVDNLTPQSIDIASTDPNILTISGLTAGTLNTLTLIFATEYSDTTKNSSSTHPIPVTTQSNRVSGTVATTTGMAPLP